MKAIIPAAGLGTRFLPATKNTPKEMLPLVDKPAIQYVVEEAVASGIRDILVITGRGKRAIEDHFDRSLELEAELEKRGDVKQLAEMRAIAEMADIHYIRQKEMRGLGDAIRCARHHIGDEAFAVLLGDDVVFNHVPCTKQLVTHHERVGGSIVAVERIPRDRTTSYGVVAPRAKVAPGLFALDTLVEKPLPEDAPSDLGILGRYILSPGIFDAIDSTSPGKNGEIQLTDALRLLNATEPVYAATFEGTRHDLGNKLDWLKTNIDVALMRPDLRDELRAFMKERLG